MKTIKMPLLALGFLFAISAVFAFNITDKKETEKPVASKATLVAYHYTQTSMDIEDLQNPAFWEEGDLSCGNTGSVPCVIFYDGTETQFEAYLLSFEEPEDILARADEKKNP